MDCHEVVPTSRNDNLPLTVIARERSDRSNLQNTQSQKDLIDDRESAKDSSDFIEYSEKIDSHDLTSSSLAMTEANAQSQNATLPNFLIKGNNLLALHSLKHRKDIYGQVKLIYIDPPYNTGNDSFNYNDNFTHSAWLTFMKNRLEIAREFLREDGVIFVQCDDNEQAYLKVLMDEIFGRGNFVANFIWEKKGGRQNDARWYSTNHEYILNYAKNKVDFKPNLLERTQGMLEQYKNPDNDHRGVWTSISLHAKDESANGRYSITFSNGVTYQAPIGSHARLSYENMQKAYNENRLWFGENGKNIPRLKKFLSEIKSGVTANTILFHSEVGNTQKAKQEIKALFAPSLHESKANAPSPSLRGDLSPKQSIEAQKDSSENMDCHDLTSSSLAMTEEENVNLQNTQANTPLFATPKPEALLKRIIEISTKEGDLIMDFFAGSGTTLAVAHKMKRRWIGIEQMDYIESITKERLKKVIAGEQGGVSKALNWQGGGSFVYLELMPLNAVYKNKILRNSSFVPSSHELDTRAAVICDEQTPSHSPQSRTNLAQNTRITTAAKKAADKSEDEFLNEIYKDLQEKAFIDYRVDIQAMLKDKEFEALSIENKQKLLYSILDSNMDYVLYDDIEDSEYKIDKDLIALNKAFYGLK